MGPSPHVWFLDAKQRDLHQNDKSIWVPALLCVFFHAKQRLYDQTYKSIGVTDLICGFEHT